MTSGKRLLIHRAERVATMDDQGTEWPDASILIEGRRIAYVGAASAVPQQWLDEADEVIDARGHVVIPGLINTHHHMYQSLTRAVPAAQNAELFTWLKTLYPIWARITPDMIHVSTQVAMAELLRSGCTTSSDHLYLYPNGAKLDDSVHAAQEIGMRFHACRGSMSVGESAGGLPPDHLVEREDEILKDSERVVLAHQDASDLAMTRVALAPCSPFSVSKDLMRESAYLGRRLGVRLHTHLAENDHDVAYSQSKFGCTPTQYAEDLGWLGDDVWHAHCVKLDATGIARFAATGTRRSPLPCSNMRLASGIAPVRKMIDAGVPVGLGVDGSASNDAAHLLAEARQAMLLARVGRSLEPFGCDKGPSDMSARDALRLATRGSARVLGRDDIGQLAVGKAADLAIFDLRTLDLAGAAVHDPVASLVFGHSATTAWTIVNGQVVVDHGHLSTVDLGPLLEKHNQMAKSLIA